jgi:hypothetical protein
MSHGFSCFTTNPTQGLEVLGTVLGVESFGQVGTSGLRGPQQLNAKPSEVRAASSRRHFHFESQIEKHSVNQKVSNLLDAPLYCLLCILLV